MRLVNNNKGMNVGKGLAGKSGSSKSEVIVEGYRVPVIRMHFRHVLNCQRTHLIKVIKNYVIILSRIRYKLQGTSKRKAFAFCPGCLD